MLPTISELFNRAYAPYRKFPRFAWIFIILFFLPILFLGITKFSADLVSLVYGVVTTNGLLLVVGAILMSFVSLWFNLAYLYALADIDEGMSPNKISNYLKKGKKVILPAFALSLLVGIIVLGGLILLIIPCFIFGIWFVFTLQARVLDEKKGVSALTYSKSLVEGNWWGVFGRIVVSMIVVYVILSVFGKLMNGLFQMTLTTLTFQKLTILSLIVTLLTSAVQAILTPFATAIPTILYLDLKKAKSVKPNPLEPPIR